MSSRAREWLVPLLLGVLAGASLWVLDPDLGPGTVDPEAPLPTPFRNVTAREGPQLLLIVGPVADRVPYTCAGSGSHAAAPSREDGGPGWVVLEGTGDCHAPGVTLRRPATCPCVDPARDVVGLTFFVFDGEGRMLATNAPLGQRGRFPAASDFQEVPLRTWYFGDGATPPGAFRPPPFVAAAGRALDGLPVGGVVGLHIEEHPYRNVVGDLFVTVRVDSIRRGPVGAEEAPPALGVDAVWTFQRAAAAPGSSTTFLLLAPNGPERAEAALAGADEDGRGDPGALRWHSDHVATYATEAEHAGCYPREDGQGRDCRDPFWTFASWPYPVAVVPEDPGPVAGEGGGDAANVTIRIFTLAGREVERGPEPAPWFLGDGTPPSGTVSPTLPGDWRVALAGRPVGGVATLETPQGFATVRVDALLPA